jgi:transposase InsO family protein
VPVLLLARPPLDAAEERTIRKLAGARHAPGDWIQRARMIAHSWDGLGTTQIADQLGCHPQTVRERLHRFNAEGVDGLGDRPGPGRPRRLTETERGRIIALARSQPPGRLHQGAPPPEVTVVCADELGPVIPRSFPPAPGWTADGHRVKALLDYGRGPEKTWVYGALRVADGQEVTMTAPSRNSVGYQRLLAAVEAANPAGTIMVITDNLSSHTSASTRTWLADHRRIQHTFIPKRACWLNLQEGWWRLFRRQALAGQSFATPEEITLATRVATCQLNARARPWVWGRPPLSPRHRRRVLVYRL